MSLREIIKERVKRSKDQTISYEEFMRLALYHPEKGYYARPRKKIGKEGDFYTSVSVGSVFGEVLARALAEMVAALPQNHPRYLIEFGGGDGRLARQILNEWRASAPHLIDQVEWIMIERSPHHRRLQQEKLAGFPARWLDDWEAVRSRFGFVNAVVYSNELLDAFPARVLEYDGSKWGEVRIGWDDGSEQFVETLGEIVSPELERFIQREEKSVPKQPGYRIEANLEAEKWLRTVSRGLGSGYVLTIDYGFERDELYLPQRSGGTMMCYRGHLASTDPLSDPGEKDITTHVNFSALMEIGLTEGMENLGLFSQRQFLINCGIFEKLQDHQDEDLLHSAVAKRNRAIRQLIMPGGMGDVFKTLVQAKGNVKRDLKCLKRKAWI